ncbi:MAG: immunoglobulin-like domain-containing protein [Oscillospiraceae bacterium]|nr:immunoglobulin-like domain-containing protein [Oscillospiraceae bacterium]
MTKNIISKIAAISAAAAIASGTAVLPSSAADSYSITITDNDSVYCPEFTDGRVDVTADNSVVNPDEDEYLDFTVYNSSGEDVHISSPVSENCFVQKLTADGWVTVYGNDLEAVPIPYDDIYDYNDGTIYYYEDDEVLPPYFAYTDSLNVSGFEDGDYRMGFYTNYYSVNYLYFTVRRSISAVLSESMVYTGDTSLKLNITNNLPYETVMNLDPELCVIEKYSGGKWTILQPKKSSGFYDTDTVIAPYETEGFTVDLSCYGELSKGEYRLSFDWNSDDVYYMPMNGSDTFGTCTVNFKVTEPMTMTIIPTSVDKASDMKVRVKITNNSDSKLRIYDYGKLQKKLGTKWHDVRFKSNAKELSGYRIISPGKTAVVEIKLDDYYNVKTLGEKKYRIELPINGKSYYCTFTISHGKYYTIK